MKLVLHVPKVELYNEETETFMYTPEANLTFIHSLVSVSKWESKHHKPMLKKDVKTNDEILDYIRIMTITKNVPDIVYTHGLTSEHMATIASYMEDPMTATTFPSDDDDTEGTKKKAMTVTSEVIYGWMVAFRIPKECEKWHINRLLTLVRVCEVQNAPAKKQDARTVNARNARLNAQRRAKYNTKG